MDKKIIILPVVIIILAIILWVGLDIYYSNQVSVLVDKAEYLKTDALTVTLENNTKKDVCVSSCKPYAIEKKNGSWVDYQVFSGCPSQTTNETCLKAGESKRFKIDLSMFAAITSGSHRLKIPLCVGCEIGQPFPEKSSFYSNTFIIK